MDNTHKCFLLVLLAASVAFATAQIPCATDLDCQEANLGNVCMDGICGYAQEPMDETVDNCYTDDFCFNLGYDYCGENGTCIPHEPLQDVEETIDNCNTNAFCVGEGYDMCGAQGFCANEEVDACATDSFCSSEGYDYCDLGDGCNYSDYYGLMHCGQAGFCEYESPYGIHACTTDEYCQQNNLGNECMDGVCGHTQPPSDSMCFPIALILTGGLGAALFISKK
ncbi:hypothetical protein JW721_00765 [Candidatus Micrarchaeota archaeon]|nr:hypothetical protein [Candidatus Micrarchaeota archaeon]